MRRRKKGVCRLYSYYYYYYCVHQAYLYRKFLVDSFIWFKLAASERAGAMMYLEAAGNVL